MEKITEIIVLTCVIERVVQGCTSSLLASLTLNPKPNKPKLALLSSGSPKVGTTVDHKYICIYVCIYIYIENYPTVHERGAVPKV